jgi:hypothetical protein
MVLLTQLELSGGIIAARLIEALNLCLAPNAAVSGAQLSLLLVASIGNLRRNPRMKERARWRDFRGSSRSRYS